MKQHRKLAVLPMLILIALISVSLVYAQPSIGSTTQAAPFESSPTAHATDKSGMGAVVNPTYAYDANWDPTSTPATIPLTGNALFPMPDTSVRSFEVKTFNTTGHGDFDPDWVDIKVRYVCPTTTDDQYRIRYRVTPDSTWYDLQVWVSGSGAEHKAGTETLARNFHDIAEPNNGLWDWTDVGNLVVRIETQMVGTNDAKSLILYEVWATVFPAPKPPTSSSAISIQPSVVMDARVGESFFVDVYTMGVTGPQVETFGIKIQYDTNVLTATNYYTYNPFINLVPSEIDDVLGQVKTGGYIDVGKTGLIENGTLCRIYFVGDAGGVSNLTIYFGELKQAGIDPIYPPTYEGWVSVGDIVMSAYGSGPVTRDLTDPYGMWHELHPEYCKMWELTSWEDTQPSGEPGYGELSECDQIDMLNETGWKYWFHVVEVTVTVHWEFKPVPSGEAGAGEPQGYPEYGIPPWDPEAPPVGTGLHEIYPTYCRGIYIAGHEDTDGSGTLNPSDQMTIMYMDDYSTYDVHVTGISTDIHISQKPIPPEPPAVPEFPLGLGLMIAIAPAIPIVYLWRTRKKEK